MDRNDARELELAMEFLRETGIELRPCSAGYDVSLAYMELSDSAVLRKDVAKVFRQGALWEVQVAAAPIFWGPDWEEHPDLIACDSLDGVLQFLYEALGPRLDSHGVVKGWQPRGSWQ